MKVINTREYVSVLRELTEEGREVSMVIVGSSMSPFLSHGRDVIFFKKPDRELRQGDMVFYQRRNGRFVMHRIYKVKTDGYYMVGDAQKEIEGPIDRNQIFALITKVKRKNKLIQPGDFWWVFFEKVWLRIIPFRDVFIKGYALIKR